MPKNTSTKQKIIQAALLLFNKDGIVNVRLQHIADEAFVSVGNLAYHYANKAIIAETIYTQLRQEQEALLKEYRVVPLFDYLDRMIRLTFQLQERYLFFYQDTLEIIRAYPEIGKVHQQHIEFQIAQWQNIVSFNIARGALLYFENQEALAHQLWFITDFWRNQQLVKTGQNPSEEAYRKAVWQALMPYFSDMGKREYGQIPPQTLTDMY